MSKMCPELKVISKHTMALWYRVNEKYGEHVYTLGANGIGEVVLSKGYCETIIKGNNRQVQKVLKELLSK